MKFIAEIYRTVCTQSESPVKVLQYVSEWSRRASADLDLVFSVQTNLETSVIYAEKSTLFQVGLNARSPKTGSTSIGSELSQFGKMLI